MLSSYTKKQALNFAITSSADFSKNFTVTTDVSVLFYGYLFYTSNAQMRKVMIVLQ